WQRSPSLLTVGRASKPPGCPMRVLPASACYRHGVLTPDGYQMWADPEQFGRARARPRHTTTTCQSRGSSDVVLPEIRLDAITVMAGERRPIRLAVRVLGISESACCE